MKEITRIHIAKVSYDIELLAKKELDNYIKDLSQSANDPEVMADVEVRITELLAERGIVKDGVITHEDITAIRAQLGEPRDFAGETGDSAVGADPQTPVETPHRLYRDTDTPVVGGVLSGIAKYFGIDPLWTRIGFLVLCLASVGTLLLIYVILWLVIPPARSATEKLQLEGKPVTLASIKELSAQEATEISTRTSSAAFQKTLCYGTGAIFAISAFCTLIMTIGGGILLALPTTGLAVTVANPFLRWSTLTLLVLSGLLLAMLLSLVSYALFHRTWNKRLGIATVALIVAGMLSFVSAVGTVAYSEWQRGNELSRSRTTKNVALPHTFTSISHLTITDQSKNGASPTSPTATIRYVVTDKKPYYEVTRDSTTKDIHPLISYANDTTATITMNQEKETTKEHLSYTPLSMTIYGPALDTILLNGQNLSVDYTNTAQDHVSIENIAGSFNLLGVYKTVTITTDTNAETTLTAATIETLQTKLRGGSLSAGVVRSLQIEQSDICPMESDATKHSHLTVAGVSSDQLTYNGAIKPAKTLSQACGDTVIGSESESDTSMEREN